MREEEEGISRTTVNLTINRCKKRKYRDKLLSQRGKEKNSNWTFMGQIKKWNGKRSYCFIDKQILKL